MFPLLDVLVQKYPDSSKNTLRLWVDQGRIVVNGSIAKSSLMLVSQDDAIVLGSRNKYLPKDVITLYEDRDLIVLIKPEGLLTVATEKESFATLHNILKNFSRSPKVYPVHRLDREASGVLVFAYNEQTRDFLKKQFEDHTIYREYHAIVEGSLTNDSGTWQSYMEDDPIFRVKETVQGQGKLAISHYTLLAKSAKFSYLKIILETGRKNQIRVHCQSASHPIVGDKKYGSLINPLGRMALHAKLLTFIHPKTKKKMMFEAPIPPSFTGLFPKKVLLHANF